MLSLGRCEEVCWPKRTEPNVLHVEEGMEEGIDELSRECHEPREIVLQRGVDIIIFVGRQFKVLLQLDGMSDRDGDAEDHTLNRFFSSLRDFSFLSLSFVNDWLKRS